MFPGGHYEQYAVNLEAEDLFLGFTDGVTEAPNSNDEEFGDVNGSRD
jgi:serine phosphatase RsbU (regulator of sigma subunit)